MKQILLPETFQTLKSPVLFCRYCISVILVIMSLSSTSQTTFMYAKSIGSSGDDQGRAVLMDPSGNVYSAGYFSATADFDPGAGTTNLTASGGKDAYVSKFGPAGNFIWAKQLGGGGDELANAMTIDASGNLLITGTFTGTADFDPGAGTFNFTAVSGRDIFICKLDASGAFVWAKQIGGLSQDDATSIAVDAAGNVFTAGNFQGTVDFNPGASTQLLGSSGGDDIFISSLDASGNHRFARKMGGAGNEYANAIEIDGSGNIITTGIFNGSGDYDPGGVTFTLNTAGANDIFISKLNATGAFVWARSIGGAGTDVATALVVNSTGDIYTTGYFQNTVDFNPGAGAFNLTSSGGTDIFVNKLDASGTFLWSVKFGGAGNEQAYATHIDIMGNIFVTGMFSGPPADFDPGSGVCTLTSAGGNDIFESKLDPTGTFISAVSKGGPLDDVGRAILIDGSGDIVSTGSFQSTADFDPSSATFNLTAVAGTDIFVTKLSSFTLLYTDNIVLSAENNDHTNTLYWNSTETNTKPSFVVERSTDGVTYNKISVDVKQQANGTYKVEDYAPGFEKVYYRIRKTDGNTRVSFSNTVAVNNQTGLQFNIRGYNASNIQLSVSGRPGSRVKVAIFDLNGNRVGTGIAEMKTQKQDIIIKLTNTTSSRLYAIQVANESDTKSSIFRLN